MKKATNATAVIPDGVQQSLSNVRPLPSDDYSTAVMYGRAYAEDTPHPLQKKIRFVFTDFMPNGNKQGVPETEAENVIATSLYMPVKINFDGQASTGHNGAEPIGPIIMLEKEQSQIIGSAIVWTENNEDIVDYLLSASAETDGVQFSWELFYKDSIYDDSGVEWLHGIISAGICIVDDPAYKGRTPLLAIAEQQNAEQQNAEMQEGNQMEELQAQVQALTERLYTMMEALYAALDEVQPQANTTNIEEDFNSLLDKLRSMSSQLSEKTTQAETLTQEIESLRQFKAQVESEANRLELIKTRKAALDTAGIKMNEESFAQKEERILAMDEASFEAYVNDLKEVMQQNSTQASNQTKASNNSVIPDPLTHKHDEGITVKDLAEALRSRRSRRIEDSSVLNRD